MKILLISDTHGDISKVIEILDRVKGIDMILHCGDYETDARILENCTDIGHFRNRQLRRRQRLSEDRGNSCRKAF